MSGVEPAGPTSAGSVKIGVLVDSERPSRWVAGILESLDGMDGLDWVVTFLEPSSQGAPGARRPLAVRAFEALDRRHQSRTKPNVLAPQDVSHLTCARAQVHLEGSAAWDPDCAPSAREISVLVDLRECGSADPTPTDAIDVWSLETTGVERGANVPPLFWAVARGRRLCGIRLLVARSATREVVATSVVSLAPGALSYSQHTVFRRAAELVLRRLRRLEVGGPGLGLGSTVDPVGLEHTAVAPVEPRGSASGAAMRLAAARLWRFAANAARAGTHHRFQWMLGIRPNDNGAPGSATGFVPCIPPPDRSYADPFLVVDGERSFVFYERWGTRAGTNGVIEVMDVSGDGALSSPRVVLERDYHLSYPFVFSMDSVWWMIPETGANRRVELYRAKRFPDEWEFYRVLIDDIAARDSTLLVRGGRLWLFAAVEGPSGGDRDELYVFTSDDLTGEWTAHPMNPVVSDVRHARPAGGLFEYEGRLIRPAQDCSERYGGAVVFREVDTLTALEYGERTCAVQRPDWLPGLMGTHHFSRAGAWEITDGMRRIRVRE